jgi:hypothetical protein
MLNYKTLLGATAATTIGIFYLTGQQAQAGVLTAGTTFNVFLECINDGTALVVGNTATDANGWQYAADAKGDGSGGSVYDIGGMAVKETANTIMVVLKGNLPLTGNMHGSTNINWANLFINFSGQNFTDAMNSGKLYGVEFTDGNDFGIGNGLYSGVTAQSVTANHVGYSSINKYNQNFSNATIGDLGSSSATTYFDKTKSINAISAGTFVTGISFLDNLALTTAGYDTSKLFGSQTIAFQFDKSGLTGGLPTTGGVTPGGGGVPGVGGQPGPGEAVPEPATIGGMLLGGWLLKMKRDRQVRETA